MLCQCFFRLVGQLVHCVLAEACFGRQIQGVMLQSCTGIERAENWPVRA